VQIYMNLLGMASGQYFGADWGIRELQCCACGGGGEVYFLPRFTGRRKMSKRFELRYKNWFVSDGKLGRELVYALSFPLPIHNWTSGIDTDVTPFTPRSLI